MRNRTGTLNAHRLWDGSFPLTLTLSLREREHSAALLESELTVTTRPPIETRRGITSCSLSPRERVRVRGNGRSIGADASSRHAGFHHTRVESLIIQNAGNDKGFIPLSKNANPLGLRRGATRDDLQVALDTCQSSQPDGNSGVAGLETCGTLASQKNFAIMSRIAPLVRRYNER